MSDASLDAIVEDYLRRLRRSLEELPGHFGSQVFEEISGHVNEARAAQLQPETEVSLRTILDRVGDPAEIAAEAAASTETEGSEDRPPPSGGLDG